MARNLFLDGNSFEPSRSVSKRALVGDLVFGAAVTFNFARLAFSHVIRTREYKTQGGDDQYGDARHANSPGGLPSIASPGFAIIVSKG